MKAVIARKVYDTETAERLARWTSPHYTSDFGWHAESLYRTKNGALFLLGEGHAASPWSRPATGGGSGPGWDIVRMTSDEAIEWLERHEMVAELESLFPAALQEA